MADLTPDEIALGLRAARAGWQWDDYPWCVYKLGAEEVTHG